MKLNLKRQVFTECEYELISHGNIKVFAFKYSTGRIQSIEKLQILSIQMLRSFTVRMLKENLYRLKERLITI